MSVLGTGRFTYEISGENWGNLPDTWSYKEATALALDSHDNVHVFNRGLHPMIVLNSDGDVLRTWGEGVFSNAHGVAIGPDDSVYCVDNGDHTVRKFSPEGKLLMTIGVPGEPAPPLSGDPFSQPTHVAVDKRNGDLFVSDGYYNARVHKFSPDGQHLFSWGESGTDEGQFNLPHNIATDQDGWVYVADRENSRVQLFTPNGEFKTSWDFVNRPDDIFIDEQDNVFVAELGFRVANVSPLHFRFMESPPPGHDPIARVSVCTPDGEVITRIGGEEEVLPGNFIAPHGLWVSPKGDLYVGEVVLRSGAVERLAPLTCQAFQVFRRSR